ncbi:MAG: hypothetical protein AB2815_01290 [Candidatus Sedimenticola endophacoides]
MALEAIDRADSTDKEKVRAEIEKTSNFVGTGGVFNIESRGPPGPGTGRLPHAGDQGRHLDPDRLTPQPRLSRPGTAASMPHR